MKHLLCLIFMMSFLLSGCAKPVVPETKQYTATFLTLFDTVTTIVGRAESEEAFKEQAQKIHDELLVYHQLFDIYNDYEGVVNLKTVNENAGQGPIQVDDRIIQLLTDCKAFYGASNGKINVAMGSVLSLWHEARSFGRDNPAEAYLPDEEELRAAAEHMDLDAVIIDEEKSTVCITDPLVQLDVGAIGKGWSAQRVAETAPSGMLISLGGNVCATGPKDEKGTPWVIGIQNPDNTEKYLHTINVTGGSVVTSGDYQRTYGVDGKLYHHIIDPKTLYPSNHWRAVSIVGPDSGVADALSTALFLMTQEEGQLLLEQYNAEAVWVGLDGSLYYSPGFEKLIRT